MTWYQEWFGEEYLDLYAHRDDREAKLQVDFLHKAIGRISGPVLDLACGGGRHLTELRGRGYSAIGVDLSLVLLNSARSREGSIPIARGDMRHLPFCDRSFAGLVNFFTSFGYFEHEDDNTGVVREMARVLDLRGRFLFDYMNMSRELARLVPREERHADGEQVLIERWFDSATRTFNKRIHIGPKRFLERVRAYDVDEISALFTASGLSIDSVYGDFEGNSWTAESPRLIVIGEKR